MFQIDGEGCAWFRLYPSGRRWRLPDWLERYVAR
jgi:hypothetical protein